MKIFHLAPVLLFSTIASAQPSEGVDAELAPADGAFELAIGTGFAQGGGKLGGGMRNLEDLAGPGGSVELDAGYRATPNLTVGLYGTFSKFQHGDFVDSSTDVLGASAGIQAAVHLRPDHEIDPWVSIGTGWKGLWLSPDSGKTTSLQGLELARIQVGVDYRISKEVSIAPVIGGSLGMYISQDSPSTMAYTELADKQVNFTGYAGLSGRFDLGK